MTYANIVDPYQTAPALFAIQLSILETTAFLTKKMAKNVWNKMSEILEHLRYSIFKIKTTPLIRLLCDRPKSGFNRGILLDMYFLYMYVLSFCLRGLDTFGRFSAIFTRELTFVTSCLPSCTPSPQL